MCCGSQAKVSLDEFFNLAPILFTFSSAHHLPVFLLSQASLVT
jgi:hypothetical protein